MNTVEEMVKVIQGMIEGLPKKLPGAIFYPDKEQETKKIQEELQKIVYPNQKSTRPVCRVTENIDTLYLICMREVLYRTEQLFNNNPSSKPLPFTFDDKGENKEFNEHLNNLLDQALSEFITRKFDPSVPPHIQIFITQLAPGWKHYFLSTILTKIKMNYELMIVCQKNKGIVIQFTNQDIHPIIPITDGLCYPSVLQNAKKLVENPSSSFSSPTPMCSKLHAFFITLSSGYFPKKFPIVDVVFGEDFIGKETCLYRKMALILREEISIPVHGFSVRDTKDAKTFSDTMRKRLDLQGDAIAKAALESFTHVESTLPAITFNIKLYPKEKRSPLTEKRSFSLDFASLEPQHAMSVSQIKTRQGKFMYRVFELDYGEFEFDSEQNFVSFLSDYIKWTHKNKNYCTFELFHINAHEIDPVLQFKSGKANKISNTHLYATVKPLATLKAVETVKPLETTKAIAAANPRATAKTVATVKPIATAKPMTTAIQHNKIQTSGKKEAVPYSRTLNLTFSKESLRYLAKFRPTTSTKTNTKPAPTSSRPSWPTPASSPSPAPVPAKAALHSDKPARRNPAAKR